MAGTVEGGKSAASTNIKRYGEDFYRKIGTMGGRATRGNQNGGFTDRELARRAGALGGRISKRPKKNG